MKKLLLKVFMLACVLGMSTNVAWADEDPMLDYYWARLIAQPSTGTGGAGKVCVTSDGKPFNYESPAWKSDTSRAEGYSQIYIEISAGNMFTVDLTAHALPDEGSYFTGWSFSNGGTDLGIGTYEWEKYELRQFFLPSKKYGYSNLREYEIYATFMPLLIESYTISGSNTTESRTCTQTVTFRVAGTLANVKDFNVPEIIKQTGSGTWTVVPNTTELWEANKPSSSDYVYSDTYDNYAEIRVPITFTADDDNAGEFSATLQLHSKAGKTMNVVLSARTVVASDKDISLYDGKTYKTAINFSDLATFDFTEYANPIAKLNGDYSDAVSINKNITFDLNGYTLRNTLTVSGGNVTLAYSPFGGTISSNVSVTGGKLTLTGGTITANVNVSAGATLEQNGAAITGNVTNAGTMTTTDGAITGQLASSGTLTLNGGTFTNNSGVAVNITGGTAQIKKGTINGSTYGVQSAGSTAIEKLAAITGTTRALKRTAGTLTVNNGKFSDPADLAEGDIVFNAAYFQNTTGTTAFGKQVWRNTAGAEYRDGYLFFVGDQEAAQASNVSVCRIGKTAYASLEEAFAYANNNPSKEVVIFMENDYTLKAGYYTIPENATLVIPMSDEQDATYSIVPRESGSTPTPYAFRTLTLENGVNMNVLGAIELTCSQYCLSGQEAQSIPGGPFGHMILKPGSHITLASGSELRAWGYITGDGTRDAEGNYLSGEIDARRGSVVREQFQMGDWKGGDISFTMIMDQAPQNMTRLFPVYEYFIQNIESPVKYHPGASLICAVSVDVSFINAYANEIRLIGVETSDPDKWSMFMMDETADAENTWVRKYYDAKKDQQVYEVNNSAQLGSLKIDLGEVPGDFFGIPGKYHIELDSRKFVLPLTSNFKIHLLSGLMQFTQSTSCLPGMEVEVDKEAEIQIIPSSDPGTVSGALYLYDADQWSFMNMKLGSYVGLAGNPKYGAIVTYSATLNAQPSVRNIDSPEALGDAKLIVHGTFRSAKGCSVYTTWTKGTGSTLEDNPFVINPAGKGGASIISTNEDAGTFIFDDASPNFDGVHWDDPANFGKIEHLTGFGNSVLVNFDNNYYGDNSYPIQIYTVIEKEMKHSNKYTRMYGFELCTPAKLQNGDGTLVETEGSPARTSYCYMNGRWTTMQVAEENECFMKDNYGTFYAKPAEYVAVSASVDGEGNVVGNADHTFSDKDGAGRLFILMADDCQWWEVENVDNLYHCIHPNNDTYYYWDETEGKWMEQRFTITWKNYDGTEIKSYTYDPVTGDPEEVEYSVTYGTQATFLGSNPTRDADIDYTYDFAGWNPELGPVKSNVTYTATYVQKPRKYTIIFTEEGGAEIERHFLLHNDMPECENVPTRTGFTLQWEPALAAVTGDATYRATWLEEPPTEYEITFIDYDGTELKKGNVEVGTMPMPPVSPSGKPATSIYTYVFDHWSPTVEKVSQAMTYTAVYREENRKYSVTFKNEDNSLIEINEYSYGETPVCSTTPTKDPTAQYTYAFAWTPQIQTVMGDAVYTATFTPTTNKYSVSVKCSPSGAATVTGSGLYDYNESATAVTVGITNVADGYEFDGWADLDDEDKKATSRQMAVTGDINLVAEFTCSTCDNVDIVWNNWDGSHLKTVSQAKGTATTYTGATPQKAADAHYTYKFDGWTRAMNTKRDYKNGLTPVAAEGGAIYYAHFDSIVNTYKVTLASNPAGVATLAGAGTYNYNDADEAVTIAVTNYNHDNFTFTGWTGDIENASESFTTAITGNINLTANFESIGYTINWYSEDGEDLLATNADLAYGTKTVFGGATPTKDGSGAETYTFDGWTTIANGEGAWYAKGNTPSVTGDANYYAHFRVSANNIEIGNGESETLNTYVERKDLVLTSNGYSNSGELIGSNYLTLQGDAHFDMTINAKNHQWYAVAVPWQVDATSGISVNGKTLTLGSDFDLVYYDGARRAAEGKVKAWRYVEDDANKIMYPGKLYMIGLMADATTIRFTKRAEAGLLTTTANVTTYPSGVSTDANWNGVANPALFKAYVNPGANYGQTYNPDTKEWGVFDFSEGRLVVGQGAFVQAPNPKAIVVTNGGSYAAPRRAEAQNDDVKFDVRFAAEGATYADRLIVETTDEKEEEGYVIGQDLVKFSVSSKNPQMWINRYDQKLCVNTAELINETAEYPLGISVPAAGNYTIRIQYPVESKALYLTCDGQAIWNLNDGAYVLTLDKGTTARYGLRISAKVPQVVTGVDEAIVDAQGETCKVLIDNKVFIIRGDKVYSIDGQLVK